MLTPTTAWYEAVTRADPRIRVLVELYDGTNTWTAVSGSMDSGSDLAGTEVGVLNVTPLAVDYDPLTREIEIGAVVVELHDPWFRPIFVNNRLKGKRCNISLGAAELDEADFVVYATNTSIEDIEPSDGKVARLTVQGQLKRLLDTPILISHYWLNAHPLEAMYDGAGGGILEIAGGHTFNATSFDRTQAIHDEIDHIIVSRASVGGYPGSGVDFKQVGSSRAVGEDARGLVTDLLQLLNGYLIENESGEIEVSRFDASASAVDTWTEDDIISGSFRQDVLGGNVVNEILYRFGLEGTGGTSQELKALYMARDTDSQSNYAYPGGSDLKTAVQFESGWVGTMLRLESAINASGSDIVLAGPACFAVSGNRSGWTVDADHPVYLYILSADPPRSEIVKCTSLTRSTTETAELFVYDGAGEYSGTGNFGWTKAGVYSSLLTFPSAGATRAQRGSQAAYHASYSQVRDITAIVLACDSMLARFGDGCPIVELETSLSKYPVQVGDLVAPVWDNYLDYGKDGLDGATKFEVIAKEVDVFSSPPRIRWRLAYAVESAGAIETQPAGWQGLEIQRVEVARTNPATQYAIGSGLEVTQDSGLDGEISAGYASNGINLIHLFYTVAHTFTASRDTYVYLDLDSAAVGRVTYKEVANGAADPGTRSTELLLAKVVTNGSAIASIDSDDTVTETVPGANVVTQSLTNVQVADHTMGAINIKPQTLGVYANANANFLSRTRG